MAPSFERLIFIAAFDHCGNHFELLISNKPVLGVGRDNDSLSKAKFVFFIIDPDLRFPVNDLDKIVEWGSAFFQFLTRGKSGYGDIARCLFDDCPAQHRSRDVFNDFYDDLHPAFFDFTRFAAVVVFFHNIFL